MKRSQINQAIRNMEIMLERYTFALPPFCHFTPRDWLDKNHEFAEVRDNRLGWDVTDYGEGDFDRLGFTLITIRNGNLKNEKYAKPYAEKLLLIKENQYSPMHFHWNKMEDIINRGGGNVLIRVYNSRNELPDEDNPVLINCDGRKFFVPAGNQIRLAPGESITIPPWLYHDFEVEAGSGPVLLGEVSACNDDEHDNRFLKPLGRFPQIEEDEPPYRLLCNEYPLAVD